MYGGWVDVRHSLNPRLRKVEEGIIFFTLNLYEYGLRDKQIFDIIAVDRFILLSIT